jgi:hypothetical protein
MPDDFKVASVAVSIYNRTGDLVEQGNAVLRENEEIECFYNTKQDNLKNRGFGFAARQIIPTIGH